MKKNILVNENDCTLVLAKGFAKKAFSYGTKEYRMLQECRRDYRPISELAEVAIFAWLFNEFEEFFICVSFLYCLACFVKFNVDVCYPLLITPREENLESSCVAVD